ncbi:MAG: 1-acyl-sn-glycerol-3-phosphate acyltransferase [Clostridia bacterium]|nr:1-acyl-sn-glycerol-3-phosphate acyltransferase [Clostridia bacterium]
MLLNFLNELVRWHAITVCWPLYALVYKTKFYYEDEKTKENKRIKGGALIVSNHISGLDYIVTVYKYFGRKIYVITLEDIFQKSGFMRWSMDVIGAIRADRDIKRLRFMDESVKILKNGKLLQIYPESDTMRSGEVQDFKPTYIPIALRSGVPIVPLVVDGQYSLFKRTHAIVGKSIYLSDYCKSADPSRDEIQQLNEMVRNKVLELQAELERRKAKKKRRS